MPIACWQGFANEAIWNFDCIASHPCWKTIGNQVHQKNHREFQAFGAVDGHDVNRIEVRIKFDGCRIVTRRADCFKIIDKLGGCLDVGNIFKFFDLFEKFGDVLDFDLIFYGFFPIQAS